MGRRHCTIAVVVLLAAPLLVSRFASGAALHIVQQFEGLADSDNMPPGFTANPPDNGLAVGPSHVFQMVNDVGRITDKLGHVVSTLNLNTFFGVDPGSSGSDPRVVYDATSGRWFAVFMNSDAKQSSSLILAVSTTSDPTGTFCRYRLGNPTAETFQQDYPFLGISDDKVVISYAAYDFGTGLLLGSGGGYSVHNKSQLMACSTVNFVRFPPDPSAQTAILMKPARAVSTTTTAYMAAHSETSVTVWSINGTPGVTPVTVSTSTVPMNNSWVESPQAIQKGSNVLLDVDARTQTVIWQNKSLWLGGNGGCLPPGDVKRSCLRLVEVSTDSMTLRQDIVYGTFGQYYFDPAVHPDGAGNLAVVFMASSASDFLSVRATGRLSTDPLSRLQPATLLRAGESALTNVLGVEGTTSGDAKVGDYSGAAVDPVDPLTVWVSSEYAKSTGDWGTYVAALSLANPVPVITLLSPSSLGAGGLGFTLTVNGGSFVSSSVVLWNGSPRPTTFVSNAQLHASISATDIAMSGSAQVAVRNPAPGGGTSSALTFLINPSFSLAVTKAGVGPGTVTSNPAGINCGASCSASFVSGTSVGLTATPAVGATFTGWSGGGCSGTGTCAVTVTAATTVTATFTLQSFTLTVTRSGTGTGTVTSAPAGISCGATCAAAFDYNTLVTLTAAPPTGSTFTDWSGGGCSGNGSCVITVTAATTVTANFNVQSFPLTVTPAGTGVGAVTSTPPGIACGATCAANYTSGMMVTLTATPYSGSAFAGWSGACSGTGSCVVTVGGPSAVTATFELTGPFSFTDPSLSGGPWGGLTAIKAVHITELRNAVNTVRTSRGLAAFLFSDPSLTVGKTTVKALHLTELRTALDQAYGARGASAPTYTDPSLGVGTTIVEAVHIRELRSAVEAVP
jgi:hypothetical protein